MKLIKHYKYTAVLSIILLVFILLILRNSDITLFKSDKKNTAASKQNLIDTALIVDSNLHTKELDELKQCLADCSTKYDKKYSIFNTSSYNDSYDKTLEAAINSGAKLIICPDSTFEETVYEFQTTYTNVFFLIIDGIPHNSDNSDSTLNFNSISLIFNESELGFLAGYAAIYEGYSNISFAGLDNDSKSLHYYYGFLQGADYAAKNTGKNNVRISSSFISSNDDISVLEKSYSSATDLMVICNKNLTGCSNDFLQKHNVKAIICDDNFPEESDNIVANTYKNYYLSTTDFLSKYYSKNIEKGTIQQYSAKDNSISLIYKTSVFTKFDSRIYDSIYMKLAEEEIQIISDTTVNPKELGLTNITIN